MAELILYAIPAFVLLLVVELLSFRFVDDHDQDLVGYESSDTRTSLTMGGGNVVINAVWKAGRGRRLRRALRADAAAHAGRPWWTYVLLFFADDLAYYWFHRVHHEVRVFWASHVVHHSTEHYNLSTALRQTWTPMTALPFWAPLALLGFPPWMILTQQAISLIYQFWIHTERIGKLPAPLECVFNTPSHHRVHHGSNEVYLDRNYGGILIVWDRLFGTFQGETERVRYGLTKNIRTFKPDPRRLPRVRRHRPRRARRRAAGATASATSSAARAGRRTAAAAARGAEPRQSVYAAGARG